MRTLTRMLMTLSLILLNSFWLAGCASLQVGSSQIPRAHIASHEWVKLPQPADLRLNVRAIQILTARVGQKIVTTQIAIEITPQHMTLVALSSWGGELFSIQYDGKKVTSKSLPIKHAGMGVRQTLTDVILTYAPTRVIKELLKSTNIVLRVKPRQRIFSMNGKSVIKIAYQYHNPWRGKVTLRNLADHYQIDVTTISMLKNKTRHHD